MGHEVCELWQPTILGYFLFSVDATAAADDHDQPEPFGAYVMIRRELRLLTSRRWNATMAQFVRLRGAEALWALRSEAEKAGN